MNYELRIKNTFLFFIFILLISVDQISKHLIRLYGGFSVCNENVAFGIILPSRAFFPLWLGAVGFLGYLFLKEKHAASKMALVIIFAGAIGNMLDRAFFGCVQDFIAVGFWPTFNLADCFITFGTVFFLAKKLKM